MNKDYIVFLFIFPTQSIILSDPILKIWVKLHEGIACEGKHLDDIIF